MKKLLFSFIPLDKLTKYDFSDQGPSFYLDDGVRRSGVYAGYHPDTNTQLLVIFSDSLTTRRREWFFSTIPNMDSEETTGARSEEYLHHTRGAIVRKNRVAGKDLLTKLEGSLA